MGLVQHGNLGMDLGTRQTKNGTIFFSWAGLMISGLSRAYQALGDSAYLERATRAAQFVQSQLYKADSGRLIRNAYRDNSSG